MLPLRGGLAYGPVNPVIRRREGLDQGVQTNWKPSASCRPRPGSTSSNAAIDKAAGSPLLSLFVLELGEVVSDSIDDRGSPVCIRPANTEPDVSGESLTTKRTETRNPDCFNNISPLPICPSRGLPPRHSSATHAPSRPTASTMRSSKTAPTLGRAGPGPPS